MHSKSHNDQSEYKTKTARAVIMVMGSDKAEGLPTKRNTNTTGCDTVVMDTQSTYSVTEERANRH